MPDSPSLSDAARAFLREPRVALIATIGPEGAPHQAAIWFRLEADDRILVNSLDGRRWPRELEAAGRCSLAVVDEADRYRWVAVEASVESIDRSEATRDDIVGLAKHFREHSADGEARFRSQARVSYRLRITAVHVELGG